MADVRYPIGKWTRDPDPSAEKRRERIQQIAELPKNLRAAVGDLSEAQLDTPYRDGGWTVRQTVHHLADSHLNGFTRFRLALTEREPTIGLYSQKGWAELADSREAAVQTSLAILDGVHERWAAMLKSLAEEDFDRSARHPEAGLFTVTELLSLYSWHGRHHVAHITALRERQGW